MEVGEVDCMSEGGEVEAVDVCPHCGSPKPMEMAEGGEVKEPPKRSFVEALQLTKGWRK